MAAITTEELAENIEPPQDKDGGAIWQQLEENNSWVILTNFEKHNILSIYEAIQPSLPSQRGKKPTVPDLDALVIFLIWAKMGLGHKNLAALLSIKKAKLACAINHIRLLLYAALSQKWWQNHMCPLPLANTLYPYIAILRLYDCRDMLTWWPIQGGQILL